MAEVLLFGREEACTSTKPSSVLKDSACILKVEGGSKLFLSRPYAKR